MKKAILFILMFSVFFYGCTQQQSQPPSMDVSPDSQKAEWRTIPLMDVSTKEVFTIRDFAGKKVLIESFAVWCPVCTKQQQEIQKLHEEIGEAIISISLDTDPNEDAERVKEAVRERGFTWRFAVSPPELTKALIAEFGSAVVNAPIAPVILVCEDQSARLLGRGTKNVEELKAEIERGCKDGNS